VKVTENPFANPARTGRKPDDDTRHPSDNPGYDTEPIHNRKTRHPSSGSSSSSQPRRPGTSERQSPSRQSSRRFVAYEPIVPGEVLYGDEPVEINAGAEVTVLRVENRTDRPIQVGSHYHFAEVNPGLEFEREAAWGKRLNVVSGGSMRFEPGAAEEVELIPIRGNRIVLGLRGLCKGKLDG
jgi:urease subunit beta